MPGSNDIPLSDVLSQFQQGVQHLAITAGINNAQKQMKDIQASQMDEMQKRNQLDQLSKNMVLDLTKAGAPSAAIQQAFGAVAPSQLNGPNAIQQEGLMKGDQGLQDVAAKQQSFQEAPEAAKQAELAKRDLAKQNAMADRELQIQALKNKGALDVAGTKAGATEQRAQEKALKETQSSLELMKGNKAVQQAESDLYAVKKIDRLASLYGDPDKLTQPLVSALAADFGRIMQGGAPTMHELEGITPSTLKGKLSTYVSSFTNNPTPATAGAFIKQLQDAAHGLRKDAQETITDRYGRILEPNKTRLGSDNYEALKKTYQDRFKEADQPPAGAAQAPAQAAQPQYSNIVKDASGNVVSYTGPDGKTYRRKGM